MSYTIVYDRQFIKLEDGRIIPMILCGSNNCWETTWNGKERRERFWTPYWEQSIPAYTSEDLIKQAEKYCNGGEYREHFKRGGKWVDDAAFLRFFRNGIKEAKTMRELIDERIHAGAVRGYMSIWREAADKENSVQGHTTECNRLMRSDEELTAFLNEADERLKQKSTGETIYVCLNYSVNDPLPKSKRTRKPKVRLTGEYYVVAFGIGSYVTKITKGYLHHSPYIGAAKQFRSEQEAEKWIKQRNLKIRFRGEFKVEKAA